MATFSQDSAQAAAFSLGPKKAQLMSYVINSGETSATVTASNLSRVEHILLGESSAVHTAAPSFSGNVATLTVAVPAETKASLVVQDLTYTAVDYLGALGNNITIAYTTGATAGAEVVTVVGNAISVQIEDSVSTATQVKAAIDASAAALALVSVAISGVGGNAQVAAASAPLTGGITGGARGSALLIGV